VNYLQLEDLSRALRANYSVDEIEGGIGVASGKVNEFTVEHESAVFRRHETSLHLFERYFMPIFGIDDEVRGERPILEVSHIRGFLRAIWIDTLYDEKYDENLCTRKKFISSMLELRCVDHPQGVRSWHEAEHSLGSCLSQQLTQSELHFGHPTLLQLGMGDDPIEMTAAELCRLLDISLETLSDLTDGGVLVEGTPGSYRLDPSIKQYCRHLSEPSQSSGEGMVGKTPSGQAQAKSRDEPVADIAARQKTGLRSLYLLFGITVGNIRSFRIYTRDGRAYTVYHT
jgi:hypothetical protein